MKKQWRIIVCAASLLLAATGCNKAIENKNLKSTVSQSAIAATVKSATEGAVDGKVIDKSVYNTVTEGIYTSSNGEMQIKIPKGWKAVENNGSTLIVPEDEESIADNIHVQVTDKDDKFASYTQETFEKSFEEKFGKVTFEDFENMTLLNLPAIKMVYSITQDDVEAVEYQYMIDGNYTFIITYTNVNDLLSEEELKDCLNSIVILK